MVCVCTDDDTDHEHCTSQSCVLAGLILSLRSGIDELLCYLLHRILDTEVLFPLRLQGRLVSGGRTITENATRAWKGYAFGAPYIGSEYSGCSGRVSTPTGTGVSNTV